MLFVHLFFPKIEFLVLFLLTLSCIVSQPEEISTTLETTPSQVTNAPPPADPSEPPPPRLGSIEILRIFVPPGVGNAVKVVWGCPPASRSTEADADVLLYGVFYGLDEGELTYPKLSTPNCSAVIDNLDFCTRYYFAVTTLSHNDAQVNLNDIRTAITGIDFKAPPKNLQVEYEPREVPCLLVRWSSSCANIGEPIGYIISAFKLNPPHYNIITFPRSTRADLIYHMRVEYGDKYEVKVSTNFPESKATKTQTVRIPGYLQPYKLRVASNAEDGGFLIYWTDPYVPPAVGRYYYEVYVYKGMNISADSEKYYVTRPVMVYKGDRAQYTFRVGLVSNDRKFKSLLTDPVAADLNGNVYEINLNS